MCGHFGVDKCWCSNVGHAARQDPHVNPLPEDQVTFRIATNVRGKRVGEAVGGVAAQHAGRRAVEARDGGFAARVAP